MISVMNASVTNGEIAITIDSNSPLAGVGGAALVQTASGGFLVARTAQESFSAVTAVCTHLGCTVTGYQNQMYVCPCHGSEYSTTGAVLRGPAALPLHQYTTRFSGNIVTITVA
jgi:cytochrome b6-f complex iron-sulfur subunit